MKNILYTTVMLLAVMTIFSCEDPIDIDNGFEESQIAVDAWVRNTPGEVKTITITQSQDYFDNTLPTTIDNATVSLESEGNTYEFVSMGDGVYGYDPGTESLGEPGQSFDLTIEIGEKTYTSTAAIERAPEIDSISIYYETSGFSDEGLYAQMYARDLVGLGNKYWIKSYRNDTLLNRPEEINLAYDAAFNAGTELDAVNFIFPIRFAVNAIYDDGLPRPLNSGDKVTCEIHGLNQVAFDFMLNTQTQLLNTGLFATPVANGRGNIRNAETGDRIFGVFNIAEVTRLEKTVE